MSLSEQITASYMEGHAELTKEVRRLSELNAEMLDALKLAYRSARLVHGEHSELCVRLGKAIAKAEGKGLS